jgi:hypothetical protein
MMLKYSLIAIVCCADSRDKFVECHVIVDVGQGLMLFTMIRRRIRLLAKWNGRMVARCVAAALMFDTKGQSTAAMALLR